ncbi:hypothetical protein AB0H24_15990 [Streptomyces globisporus]|nr:hypothetical protein [Streptomyces globisporus]
MDRDAARGTDATAVQRSPVQHFTVGAITVILQPINVGALKKETGRRKLM